MNLGIQDSFNIGWKLAAEINGWAAQGLLDTYDAERHPVAADVLNITRAQSELVSPDPGPQAVPRLLAELMDFDDVSRFLAERISSLGSATIFDEGPELLRRRLRDITLSRGRLYELTRDGSGLLLDQTNRVSMTGWTDRVDHAVDVSGELEAPGPAPTGRPRRMVRRRPGGPTPSAAHVVRSTIRRLANWSSTALVLSPKQDVGRLMNRISSRRPIRARSRQWPFHTREFRSC